MNTTFVSPACASQDLLDHLGRLQVAPEAEAAGGAEGAVQAASHLGG
jgi:hypothetical protein